MMGPAWMRDLPILSSTKPPSVIMWHQLHPLGASGLDLYYFSTKINIIMLGVITGTIIVGLPTVLQLH